MKKYIKIGCISILGSMILGSSSWANFIKPIYYKEVYVHENNTKNMESMLKEKMNRMDEIEFEKSMFVSKIIDASVFKRMNGISYKEEGPVKIKDLSYIKVLYWGFDEQIHQGELIVHKKLANEVLDIFKELYHHKFPIQKIRLIDEYGASDTLSMKDNNTSAFCFRPITGKKNAYSKHSYGIAIDINPIQNPYIKDKIIMPKEGETYVDRQNKRKGMILKDDTVYQAFKKRGWTWGGEWRTLKDYQHFEKNIDLRQK